MKARRGCRAWIEQLASAASHCISPIKERAWKAIRFSNRRTGAGECTNFDDDNQRLAWERDQLMRLLQLQIDRMPLAYILFDDEFRITDWNPAAEQIFGYRHDEALGMKPPFEKLIPPSFRKSSEELMNRFRSGDASAHSVNENLTKDGRIIVCEWFNTPLISDEGDFAGLLCLGRDVTDQKKAERALRESQERFELAILGSNDGLGDWDIKTGEGYWSPRIHEMLGVTQAEFGTNFSSIASRMHPDDRDRVLEEMAERTRRHQAIKHEFRLLTKSGEYCWVQGRGRAIYDEQGKPYRFAGALTDISDHKRMQAELARRDEQLRQSHKLEAVGSLAGGISHEFNNLLQVIRGYGQYAMKGLSPEDQRYQDLEQVINAADRAASLTRQLLGFSRLQLLERATFDHQEVVRNIAKLLRPLIGEQIELHVDLAPDVSPIHADRGLVQQMLLNLCINARDAMPTGGRLTLKTQCVELSQNYCKFHPDMKPGNYVVFSIADTGCGMSAEVRERIFEPFFTTKGVGKGTGLGLAMVYGSVQQHDGVVNVYSEVGIGTTFKIYLPIAAGADAKRRQEKALPATGGHETILVAEDESMVRDLAVRILTSAGYTVLVAADGAEAVELFEANSDRISLVLLDAIMPKLTGHQAYDRIKLLNPEVPAIFCSGYDPETGQIKSLMDKGCRLVQKPYDPDLLLRVLREVLDQSSWLQTTLCGA